MLTGSRPFLLTSEEAGGHRKVGGDRDATTAHNCPLTTGIQRVWCLSSSDTLAGSGALLSWGWLNLPTDGKWWMHSVFCFACMNSLISLLNCLPSQPTRFYSSYSLPHSTSGRVNGWVGLSYWLGLKNIQNWTTAKACKLKTKKGT